MAVGIQGGRYVSTAALSALSDWVVFVALRGLGAPDVGAQAVSRPVGGVVSFLLNKRWTYDAGGTGRTGLEAARFLQLYAVSYVLSLGLLHLLVGVAGVPTGPGKLAADGACFVFNFVVMRVWVFGAGRSQGVAEADGAGAQGVQQAR